MQVPPGTRNLSGAESKRLCGDHIAEAIRAQPGAEPSLASLEAMADEAEAANRWSQFADGSLNGRTLASWVGDLADVHGTTLAGAWAFVAQHARNASLKAEAASMSSHYAADAGRVEPPAPRYDVAGAGPRQTPFCQQCGSPGCAGQCRSYHPTQQTPGLQEAWSPGFAGPHATQERGPTGWPNPFAAHHAGPPNAVGSQAGVPPPWAPLWAQLGQSAAPSTFMGGPSGPLPNPMGGVGMPPGIGMDFMSGPSTPTFAQGRWTPPSMGHQGPGAPLGSHPMVQAVGMLRQEFAAGSREIVRQLERGNRMGEQIGR